MLLTREGLGVEKKEEWLVEWRSYGRWWMKVIKSVWEWEVWEGASLDLPDVDVCSYCYNVHVRQGAGNATDSFHSLFLFSIPITHSPIPFWFHLIHTSILFPVLFLVSSFHSFFACHLQNKTWSTGPPNCSAGWPWVPPHLINDPIIALV